MNRTSNRDTARRPARDGGRPRRYPDDRRALVYYVAAGGGHPHRPRRSLGRARLAERTLIDAAQTS